MELGVHFDSLSGKVTAVLSSDGVVANVTLFPLLVGLESVRNDDCLAIFNSGVGSKLTRILTGVGGAITLTGDRAVSNAEVAKKTDTKEDDSPLFIASQIFCHIPQTQKRYTCHCEQPLCMILQFPPHSTGDVYDLLLLLFAVVKIYNN